MVEHSLAHLHRAIDDAGTEATLNGEEARSPKEGTSNRERELETRVAQLEAKLAKKDAVIAEISEEYVKLKKNLGSRWVPHDTRDEIIDFVRVWVDKTELS